MKSKVFKFEESEKKI